MKWLNELKQKSAKELVLDFVYMAGSFIGAALIASNTGYNVVGYILFFMSSIAGIFLLKNSNASKSLLIVTLYYAVVNLIGIVRYV